MTAVYVKPIKHLPDGREIVDCLIVADATPAELPTTGAGIVGMNAQQIFAPFSVLYVVADVTPKTYIADESGHFIAQR